MSRYNKETFSEFFRDSERMDNLPEYLTVIDMNSEQPQHGGTMSTSTEQWNDYINGNNNFNNTLLDTLSTPTNMPLWKIN